MALSMCICLRKSTENWHVLVSFRNPGNKILHFVFLHLPQVVKVSLRSCNEAWNLTKCQVFSSKLDILSSLWSIMSSFAPHDNFENFRNFLHLFHLWMLPQMQVCGSLCCSSSAKCTSYQAAGRKEEPPSIASIWSVAIHVTDTTTSSFSKMRKKFVRQILLKALTGVF